MIDSFQKYTTVYTDATLNVRENEYDSLNTGSYVELDSLSSTQWFICGFIEKMSGVIFNFVNGAENSTSGTIMTVEYWDGEDWASVGTVDDGTLSGTISMGKNGAVLWNPPTSEFTQVINPARSMGAEEMPSARAKGTKIRYNKKFVQTVNNEVQLYYYKFSFSKTLDADVKVYHISGIPAQQKISAFKFPFYANDRLWLCSDQKDKKNAVVCSAEGSSAVFNGEDALWFEFGDDTQLIGAAWLFSSVGSSIYNVMIFFKRNEMWALIGNGPDEWTQTKYRISASVGCVAPQSIRVVDIGPEISQNLNRNIVIWQGADGVYMSDGRSPIKISDDIDDKFDQRKTTSISSSAIDKSTAGWDSFNKCYHWNWPSGTSTTINEEYVFDFRKGGWFNIDRGTSGTLDLMCNIEVQDTLGNNYNYGLINSGYMYRLEYGNAMSGTAEFTQTFWLGDMALLEGSITTETKVEYTCIIAAAKSTTANSISLTHYGDCNSTGETAWTESPKKTGYGIILPVEHHGNWPSSIFHSIKATLSTNNEVTGFEPLYLFFLYSTQRDHLRDYK